MSSAVNVRGSWCASWAVAHVDQTAPSGGIIKPPRRPERSYGPGRARIASKFAVVGLTEALALELAPFNITVNAISPGTMLTDMTRPGSEPRQRNRPRPEELLAEHIAMIPMNGLELPTTWGHGSFLAFDDAALHHWSEPQPDRWRTGLLLIETLDPDRGTDPAARTRAAVYHGTRDIRVEDVEVPDADPARSCSRRTPLAPRYRAPNGTMGPMMLPVVERPASIWVDAG